ncbi:MAG TPA: NTP transferase domain-containing protein [Gemmatimonadales bacterium]|nr:NTP transferase domain-containing protein [Gemmatimonadales bacterium]
MTLQLVVLAAGLGSRYGGLKQLEAVGPAGTTLMEYSLFDARRAGFDDVVFVIRPDMADAFRDFAVRFAGRFSWRLALQRLEDVPAGVTLPASRAKPWGTAHAVLAAAPAIQEPFAVLNADDFYGAAAFAALAAFLRAPAAAGPPHFALVGYRLKDTLSDAGPVNRGVCRIDGAGWLQDIEEVINVDGTSDRDAIVSMNLWGFTPALFDLLRTGLDRFFQGPDALRGEFLLPTVIRQAIANGECRVRVLEPGSRWFGITHQADRPGVEAELRALVTAGRYPERLWT